MKYKVCKLERNLLDAAVATAEGLELTEMIGSCWVCPEAGAEIVPYNVSDDGVLAPMIIRREGIAIESADNDAWLARCGVAQMRGHTASSQRCGPT